LSEERIQEIRVWFEERGYELFWHEHAGAWRAPYIPQGHRIGSADYGSGTTALEAVEDAKRRFEAGQPKTHVVEMTGTVGAKATLSGSAVIKTDSDSAEVVDSAQVNLPSIDEKIATCGQVSPENGMESLARARLGVTLARGLPLLGLPIFTR
jgi:hypothetical protein